MLQACSSGDDPAAAAQAFSDAAFRAEIRAPQRGMVVRAGQRLLEEDGVQVGLQSAGLVSQSMGCRTPQRFGRSRTQEV